MSKIIAIATLVIALLTLNWSVYQKEQLLENGQVVFLKLAPVDPRSLMQGDYMALRFEMANRIQAALKTNQLIDSDKAYTASYNGVAAVALDKKGIASFVGIVDNAANTASKSNNTILQFTLRKGRIKFATYAYFFEEGTGKALAAAQYGEFRVNSNGELLLVALRDANLQKIS